MADNTPGLKFRLLFPELAGAGLDNSVLS
jgi:hypothetical protein